MNSGAEAERKDIQFTGAGAAGARSDGRGGPLGAERRPRPEAGARPYIVENVLNARRWLTD